MFGAAPRSADVSRCLRGRTVSARSPAVLAIPIAEEFATPRNDVHPNKLRSFSLGSGSSLQMSLPDPSPRRCVVSRTLSRFGSALSPRLRISDSAAAVWLRVIGIVYFNSLRDIVYYCYSSLSDIICLYARISPGLDLRILASSPNRDGTGRAFCHKFAQTL